MRFRRRISLQGIALGGLLGMAALTAGAQSPGAGAGGQEPLRFRIGSEFKSAKNTCPTPSSSRVIEIDLAAPPVPQAGTTGWLDLSVMLGGEGNRSLVVTMVTPVNPPYPVVLPIDVLYERQETTLYTTMRLPDHPLCRGLILYFSRV